MAMLGWRCTPIFIPDHVVTDEPKERCAKQINQYLLVDKIGCGGISKVYLAIDEDSKRPFAAKAISLGGRGNEGLALQREVRMLRRLDHPNIIGLKEVLHCKRRQMAYLILDWAGYGSLLDVMEESLSEKALRSIVRQVCCGLAYLHKQGLAHHDIKPSNILLFANGVAKLGDFGVGHSFESTNSVVGSPAYQAPEFLDENSQSVLDPVKEDVWSLGITIFQAAFGFLPYSGENVYEIVWKVMHSQLVIPEKGSPLLKDLIKKMLDVNPATRLTLEEVMKHEWVADAEEHWTLPIDPRVLPKAYPSRDSLRSISASVCDDSYSFHVPQRSASWFNL
jgi:serine/threonine-protein kinase 11